jgi:uncharacterized protein YmfQ (DUF2313 family)
VDERQPLVGVSLVEIAAKADGEPEPAVPGGRGAALQRWEKLMTLQGCEYLPKVGESAALHQKVPYTAPISPWRRRGARGAAVRPRLEARPS